MVSDAADTANWLSAERVVEAAEHSDVVVYGIAASQAGPKARVSAMVRSPAAAPTMVSELPQHQFLQRLAATSGGRLIDASFTALPGTFARLLKDIRARYLPTCYPTNPNPGWHAIEVRLTRGHADVTARRGYWVDTAPPRR